MAKIQEDWVGACSERVELVVEARAKKAFCGVKSSTGIANSFREVVHMACPVIKVFT